VFARDHGLYEVKNACQQSEKRAPENTNTGWHSEKYLPGIINICWQMGLDLKFLVGY
jgi:hypothetical protein